GTKQKPIPLGSGLTCSISMAASGACSVSHRRRKQRPDTGTFASTPTRVCRCCNGGSAWQEFCRPGCETEVEPPSQLTPTARTILGPARVSGLYTGRHCLGTVSCRC